MSRAGDCYDNAVIESFFGTYKQEWAHHQGWTGLADARAATHDYIEVSLCVNVAETAFDPEFSVEGRGMISRDQTSKRRGRSFPGCATRAHG